MAETKQVQFLTSEQQRKIAVIIINAKHFEDAVEAISKCFKDDFGWQPPEDSKCCASCGKSLVVLQHLDFVTDNGKKYCIPCSQRG